VAAVKYRQRQQQQQNMRGNSAGHMLAQQMAHFTSADSLCGGKTKVAVC